MKTSGLVCGLGANDTNRPTSYYVVTDGIRKRKKCPYYEDWRDLLKRCSDLKYQERFPTYKVCTVHEDWKTFSNFIKWVDSQPNRDWKDCHLDKDILKVGNKHYSPDTCAYLPHKLNYFTLNCGKSRGDLMIGVNHISEKDKSYPYQAACNNPFTGKGKYLGVFSTELEAHKAWQAKKHEYALQLADLQDDPRVAKALRERYAPDKDWSKV